MSTTAQIQDVAVSGLYRIVSGLYTEVGGFAGSLTTPLPSMSQGFLELTVNPAGNDARLRILGVDGQSVYRLPAVGSRPEIPFSFSQGRVSPGHIQFGDLRLPGVVLSGLSYSVSNSATMLEVNGVLRELCLFCSDVPYEFKHTNVIAVLLPAPAIRISETEICWSAASNQTYQVQYRPGLLTGEWINLGASVVGSGVEHCVTDKIGRGEPQKYYRVLPLP